MKSLLTRVMPAFTPPQSLKVAPDYPSHLPGGHSLDRGALEVTIFAARFFTPH